MDVEDWKPEFCTVCDKQFSGPDVYCSDKCRKIDESKEPIPFTALSPRQSGDLTSTTNTESDEDGEVPRIWLSESTKGHEMPLKQQSRFQKKPSEKTFLYASPALTPSRVPNGSLSPMFIPQNMNQENSVLSQSVHTYRRWLADSV